jgi:hypothetical protein
MVWAARRLRIWAGVSDMGAIVPGFAAPPGQTRKKNTRW